MVGSLIHRPLNQLNLGLLAGALQLIPRRLELVPRRSKLPDEHREIQKPGENQQQRPAESK